MRRCILLLLAIVIILSILGAVPVQAQSNPSCSFQTDGSIVCTIGGNEGGGGNGNQGGSGNNNNENSGVCTPGQHKGYLVMSYDADAGMCEALAMWVDNCTGEMIDPAADDSDQIPCSPQRTPPVQHPCTTFSVNAGGITCSK